MTLNNKYLFFVIIILINIILKSINLDATPFWYDEMISIKDTQLDFGHIKHEAEWDNNPPFYYYCLWVWHSVIPVSEFNSRFLSVLFVSLSIGLFYLFANKYFDKKTAIASSILLTLSNFIFFYAQETRAYSLVFLLAVISTMQFFKYLNNPKIISLILLALVNFLIIYSHYIAGLIVFAQYIIILFFHRKFWIYFFSIQSVIIVSLILLRFTKKQFLNITNFNKKDDFWLQTVGLKDLFSGLSDLFFNPITASVFVIVTFVFIFFYFKSRTEDKNGVLFYCLFLGVISILILFLIGCFKPIFLSRYLIFCIPFATVIVVSQLFKFNKIGMFIVLFLIGHEIYSLNLRKNGPSDYREISTEIAKHKGANDYVIINTRDNLNLYLYYSYNHFLDFRSTDSICSANNILAFNDVENLKNLGFKKNSSIFLVQAFHNIKNNENLFVRYLSDGNEKVFSTNFYKGIEFTILKGK